MADINMDNVNIEIQSSSTKASEGIEQLIDSLNGLNSTLGNIQNNVNQYTSSLSNMTNVAKGLKMPDIKINSNIPQVAKELEFLNSKTAETKMPELNVSKSSKTESNRLKQLTNEYKNKIKELKVLSEQTGASMRNMFSSIGKGKIADLGNGITNIGKSITSTGKKMLRLTTALFGIRSAFYAVRNISNEFLSSQDATAKQLSANISYLKYALGSTLAPVIEFITNLIYNLLKAIQSIVYFFTKINIFANASAKNIASGAGSAGKTTKELKKQLQAFDELNNITLENNSGSGSGSGGSIVPSFDLTEVDNILPKFADMLLNGDWYEIGYKAGQKITEVLESIPWDKIKEKANELGTNLGLLLNGLVDGNNWYLLGKTISEGINTAVSFASGFIETTKWNNLGDAIGTSIGSTIVNIDWKKVGKLIAESIGSIKSFFTGIGEGIVDGIFEGIAEKMGKQTAWSLLKTLFIDPFIKKFKNLLGIHSPSTVMRDEIGVHIAEGVLEGILKGFSNIGQWIYNSVVKPLVDTFCKALGIHSPSKVFMSFGNDIVQGLFIGMEQLIGNIAKVAQEIWIGFTGAIQGIANWTNITIVQPTINFFSNLGNSIVQIGKNIYNGFTGAIQGIANWTNITIVQPTINFFSNLGNSIVNIGYNIYNGFTNAISNIGSFVNLRIVQPTASLFINLSNLITNTGRNIYNNFTNAISNIGNFVNSRIVQPVTNAFSGLGNNVKNIFNGIRNSITNTLSNINIKIKMPHFSWTTQPASGLIANILSALNLPTSLPKLRVDWYAEGGYPTQGDLFFANEAGPELVGSIGNKTAVANNDQITKAIAEATYRAVSQALHENQDNNQPIIVNVGNETLYKGMTRSRSQASNQYGITV